MRLRNVWTGITVISSFITRLSALPAHTPVTTTSATLTSISPAPRPPLQDVRRSSSDTTSEATATPSAKYSSLNSHREFKSIDSATYAAADLSNSDTVLTDSALSFQASLLNITPSHLNPSLTSSLHTLHPASNQQLEAQISAEPTPPQHQQANINSLGPTVALPSTVPLLPVITPPALLSTNGLGNSVPNVAEGKKWYIETYWECVTWRPDYIHCGYHTPVKPGVNPIPGGETFDAGSSLKPGLRMVVGVVVAVVLGTLIVERI